MARYIDKSKHPFKRATKTGPGPKKRTTKLKERYKCEKGPTKKGMYTQICTYKGADGKKHQITVRTKKSYKKRYNKLYRKWAANNKRIAALVNKGPRKGYVCRRTKVTPCGRAAA